MRCIKCKKEVSIGAGKLNYINFGDGQIYCARCWNAYIEATKDKYSPATRLYGKIDEYQE